MSRNFKISFFHNGFFNNVLNIFYIKCMSCFLALSFNFVNNRA
nr:MAG TPA: hypothetical protein [Caudoviricetes sp.]